MDRPPVPPGPSPAGPRAAGAPPGVAALIPVLLTSRTGAGEVLTSTYGGFPGSETGLISAGLVPGGSLDGLKVRVLLALLLAEGADRDRIASVTRRLRTCHRAYPKGDSHDAG